MRERDILRVIAHCSELLHYHDLYVGYLDAISTVNQIVKNNSPPS